MSRPHPTPVVHVVGLNPAVDRLQVLDRFAPYEVNRADQVVARAGGKSLIVARAIRRLGGPVVLHGFAGGAAGEVIAAECRTLGITDRHVRIDGETRTTVVLVERSTGRTTVINEPGPRVEAAELDRLEEALLAAAGPGVPVVLTGSLPPGVPPDFYATVVTRARAAGSTVLVDASGAPLAQAIAAGPDVVKVNGAEFREATTTGDEDDLARAVAGVRARNGIGALIVTLGAQGCVAVDERGQYAVSAPAVAAVNATGSGDSFFGAFALMLARGGGAPDRPLLEPLRMGAAAGAANAIRLEPDVGSLAEVQRFLDAVDVRFTATTAGAHRR